ncbi:MAG TPA: acyl-CoA thioesterase [Thermoanaerobaculia bacterium]
MTGAWRDGWYVVPHQVIFRDLDSYGHVNNAVFLTYFEWARTVMWFDLNGFAYGPRNINFIVARAEVDFREQLGFERIEIATRVSAMGNTSVEFLYEIRKTATGGIAATGKVVVVLFDWMANAKMKIDADLRQKVRQFQREEEV